MLRRRALLAGAIVSMVVHALVALFLVRLPDAATLAQAELAEPYEVAFEPTGAEGATGAPRRGNAPTDADRAVPGGAESAQNIDARDRGEGGDATGANDGIRLLARADGIVLFDSPLNNLAAAQTQRIRTARDRATLERRRATPHPYDDAFLASGSGVHPERRPVSATDSAVGARVAPTASVEGARPSIREPGSAALHPSGAAAGADPAREPRRAAPESDENAGAVASPGRGILDGAGARHTEAARVAHGRPPVDEGPAATQADEQDPRVRDEDDSEVLARDMMQSWVEATTRTARRTGTGRGGVGGGGTPGSGGGRDEGGRATSYGPGDGRYAALDTSDDRYRRWFLTQRRRVLDAVHYPRERALAMDQGISIFTVEVRRDGTLIGAPHLVRSSGFDDLDRAALAAIEAATPFAPLPDDLAPELERVRVRLPIEFSNPMVR